MKHKSISNQHLIRSLILYLRAEREKNSSNETLIRLPTDERALISASDLLDVGERKKLSHPPTAAAAPPPAPARSSPAPLVRVEAQRPPLSALARTPFPPGMPPPRRPLLFFFICELDLG